MTNDELTELRAALIQLANALKTERDCVVRIQRVIERGLGMEHFEEGVRGTIIPNASIAGAVGNTVTTT
ncbi:MAG TPA: hypothetical protein VIY48_16030 [Candidatus Paceibacterota bacterium]